MRSPYGLDVIEHCAECRFVADRLFCDLRPPELARLDAMKSTAVYPRHALLFLEGEKPRGVYIVCSGRVKLTTSSDDGKTLIVRIAEAGEALGISAVISGLPYELTAETLDPAQVVHIERGDFLAYLQDNPAVTLRVASQLSSELRTTYEHFRLMGLSRNAGAKLARLLLLWCRAEGTPLGNGSGVRLSMTLTHEEIAQAIDTSRETVTRLLTDLRGRGLIDQHGAMVIIPDPRALEAFARS